MAMNEDEIIRKRLIVEGDSGQDDRRIISLLKTFLKWCFMDSLSQEENEATYQKMVLTLGQIEFALSRTELIMNMNNMERKRYKEMVMTIQSDIKETQELIKHLRQELDKARLVRQHRQEYDAMAAIIQKSTSRADSTHKIQQLEKQLQDLTAKHCQLTNQLALRRKQGYLLVYAIHQLLDTLNDNDRAELMEVS